MENSSLDDLDGYIMGIDEAGRGPVLGPMVYGACICKLSSLEQLKKSGFEDSKQLTEEQRLLLFSGIKSSNSWLDYIFDVIPSHWMSSQMLEKNRYSLNELSHDSAINLIYTTIKHGFNIKEVYLDTVGTPEKYETKLNNTFMGYNIKFTVAKKADSTYPIVSAASIVAKCTRDRIIKTYQFVEKNHQIKYGYKNNSQNNNNINLDDKKEKENNNNLNNNKTKKIKSKSASNKYFGNGYPSDELTKEWLRNNVDLVFGFPRIVRFSWQTCKTIVDSSCKQVSWSDDISDNSLLNFGFSNTKNNIKRPNFYKFRNLQCCISNEPPF